MRANLRTRIGFWLERFPSLRPLLFRPHGRMRTPDGTPLYENRVNGHVVAWVRRDE